MRTGMLWAALSSTLLAIAPATLSGCNDRVEGVTPVGGDDTSPAEIERFARRLHLDLTGTPPDEAFLADALASLEADNSAAARAAFAEPLLDGQEFADAYVGELANRVFGGESPDSRYDLLCGIIRGNDPACMACAPSADPCADCACPALTTIEADRTDLYQSEADLASGAATTMDIERRHAMSQAFRGLSDPTTLTTLIFEVFLHRAAEGEELANGTAMAIGSLIPESPAGLLFHRHGASYDDLVAIVFESEVYREAIVTGVFTRYLGRTPDPIEMAHFAASLDSTLLDARPVIRAVVSSREYFDQ